jgi:hypothetical protein
MLMVFLLAHPRLAGIIRVLHNPKSLVLGFLFDYVGIKDSNEA